MRGIKATDAKQDEKTWDEKNSMATGDSAEAGWTDNSFEDSFYPRTCEAISQTRFAGE